MGREIRMVPPNWEHPKKLYQDSRSGEIKECYRPMSSGGYEEDVKAYEVELADWLAGQKEWAAGIYVDVGGERITKTEAMARWLKGIQEEKAKYRYSNSYRELESRKFETGLCDWCDVAGEPPTHPDPDDYCHEWSDGVATWYQVYETVSEGTPVTPPFATKEEVVEHIVTHGTFWDQGKDGRGGWGRQAAEQFVAMGTHSH